MLSQSQFVCTHPIGCNLFCFFFGRGGGKGRAGPIPLRDRKEPLIRQQVFQSNFNINNICAYLDWCNSCQNKPASWLYPKMEIVSPTVYLHTTIIKTNMLQYISEDWDTPRHGHLSKIAAKNLNAPLIMMHKVSIN